MKRKVRKTNHHPLLCWDIVTQQRALHEVKNKYSHLFDLKHQYGWSIDLHALLRLDFDAAVLTNIQQDILWTSIGFRKMTGYTFDEASGKKPSFLQGEATSHEVRQHIRDHLSTAKSVAGVLINYKKNGSPYVCSISITPLFNQAGELMNFIALEKEIDEKYDE